MQLQRRFISSNLKVSLNQTGSQIRKRQITFAVDLAGFYRSRENRFMTKLVGRWRAGFYISNLEIKITYDEGGQEKLLRQPKAGIGFDLFLIWIIPLLLPPEFNKLLVTTTSRILTTDGVINGNITKISKTIGFLSGGFNHLEIAPDWYFWRVKGNYLALGKLELIVI